MSNTYLYLDGVSIANRAASLQVSRYGIAIQSMGDGWKSFALDPSTASKIVDALQRLIIVPSQESYMGVSHCAAETGCPKQNHTNNDFGNAFGQQSLLVQLTDEFIWTYNALAETGLNDDNRVLVSVHLVESSRD